MSAAAPAPPDTRCRRCYGDASEHSAEGCSCGTWTFPCPCPGFLDPADCVARRKAPWYYAVLDRFFEHEVINGFGRREYLNRWVLIRRPAWAIYLHHFVASDWSMDTHDHPKRFTSIGLWGRYCEEDPWGKRTLYRAPWYRTFPAEHRHRIVIAPGETAWTLVHVGRRQREWGFWSFSGSGKARRFNWIPWLDYVHDEANDLKIAPAKEEF